MIFPQVLIIIAALLACVFYLATTFGGKLPFEYNSWGKWRQWPLWFCCGPAAIILWFAGIIIAVIVKG